MKILNKILLVLFACSTLYSCTFETDKDEDITSMQTYFAQRNSADWTQENDRYFWTEIRVDALTSDIADNGTVILYNHPLRENPDYTNGGDAKKYIQDKEVWQKVSYADPDIDKHITGLYYSYRSGYIRIEAVTTSGTLDINNFDDIGYKIILLTDVKPTEE
ncbi:MAG: hypothetical protein N4A49_03520 [Marinifilaceae bacterium]|jgi:hypothetical protein|nr:hypothetical protein [Marinifilaceae bacterium]